MKPIILITALVSLAGPAWAQNPQVAAPQSPVVPMAPQAGPAAPPEKMAPSSGNGTLSSQLSRDNGSVSPPDVDPNMAIAPGQQGTMPVVKPPGTQGGNQSVVPK
jgi:hypothetical protein